MILDLDNAESALAGTGDDQARLGALLIVARKLGAIGVSDRALKLAAEAVSIARRGDDASTLADATEVAAAAHLAASLYPEALASYLESLALWTRLAVPAGQVRCLNGIANVDLQVGDYARSLSRFEEALALLEDHPDPGAEASLHFGLGKLYMRLGEHSKAREFHELALSRRRELGDEAGIAASLNSLGVVRLRMGEQRKSAEPDSTGDDFTLAKELFEEAQVCGGIEDGVLAVI